MTLSRHIQVPVMAQFISDYKVFLMVSGIILYSDLVRNKYMLELFSLSTVAARCGNNEVITACVV